MITINSKVMWCGGHINPAMVDHDDPQKPVLVVCDSHDNSPNAELTIHDVKCFLQGGVGCPSLPFGFCPRLWDDR